MRLPFYYISTLWVVAIFSVFLIVKPLIGVFNKNSNFENTAIAVTDEIAGNNNSDAIALSKKDYKGASTNSDLIFYDKTAFIRYFDNEYAEEELVNSYDKAGITDSGNAGRPLIRVSRKKINGKSLKSFSTDFYIGPVPAPTR
jgi:hypothetical protein